MFVREVMTRDPVTVPPEQGVKDTLRLMARHGVTCLPVIDASGRICGVVSEADLIRDAVARDPRAHEIPIEHWRGTPPHTVEEVLTPHAITVQPDDDLVTAVEVMTSTSVKSLPVVDHHQRVVGIVSRSDIVRMLARADVTIAAEVEELLGSLGRGDWLVEVHDGVVDVAGPEESAETSLARVAATTVPGVIEVRIR